MIASLTGRIVALYIDSACWRGTGARAGATNKATDTGGGKVWVAAVAFASRVRARTLVPAGCVPRRGFSLVWEVDKMALETTGVSVGRGTDGGADRACAGRTPYCSFRIRRCAAPIGRERLDRRTSRAE